MSTRLPQLINGEFQQSRTDTWIPVTNPATQEVLCEVPAATAEEMESAIASAREAFLEWRETPVSERARVMLRRHGLGLGLPRGTRRSQRDTRPKGWPTAD